MMMTIEEYRARIAALEAQVAAADRLVELLSEFNMPLLSWPRSFIEMRKSAETALAAYRAIRGCGNG